jgi:S-adenosylhomocysteine hydrolase
VLVTNDDKSCNLVEYLGAELTELTNEQADYIGLDIHGPFKKGTYRY